VNATAAYYEKATRTLRVGPAPVAPPGPGAVQIAVAYGGICGTDLGIVHGKMDWRLAEAHILGHEVSGVVAAVGPGVAGFTPGDRVAVMPLDPRGDDPVRRAGLEHICETLAFLGIDAPGGFQSRWTVPAHTVFRLPDGLSLRIGALIEPLAVACHDVRLGEVLPGQTIVVLGGGPIGALIALVARDRGARVVVSELNPHRRSFFRDLGFDAVDPHAVDLAAHIKALTDGTMADVVFEVTGHPSGIAAATTLPRARGLIVIVGIFNPQAPPPVDLFRVFWRELRLRGARVYEREDYDAALALAASGRLPLDRLVSRVLPLEQIADGIGAMETGGDVMKVLLEVGGEEVAP
jgi:(R,R)-butanediol dehydrogenase/meso-butanediol dehydrogenase/diacetyl reductase